MENHILIVHNGEDNIRAKVVKRFPRLEEQSVIYTTDWEYTIEHLIRFSGNLHAIVFTKGAKKKLSEHICKRIRQVKGHRLLPEYIYIFEEDSSPPKKQA